MNGPLSGAALLAVEFAGAVGLLLPFALFQLGRLSPHSAAYLWLNLAGSALLTWAAWAHEQWGFLILQGVWTLVTLGSLAMLARRAVRRRPAGDE